MPLGNTIGYQVAWMSCTTFDYLGHNNTFSNNITIPGLITEQCYTVSVVGVSDHLPSEMLSSNITLG